MGMGSRVKEARDAKGWSTPKLAAVADAIYRKQPGVEPRDEGEYVTQQNVSVMETRDSNKSEFIAAIAAALDVSLRWLITGIGNANDRDWPLPMVERSRWDRCNEQERGYIQGAVNRALDDVETQRATANPKRVAVVQVDDSGSRYLSIAPAPPTTPASPQSTASQKTSTASNAVTPKKGAKGEQK